MKEIDKRLLKKTTEKVSLKSNINRIGLSVPTIRNVLKEDISFIGNSSKVVLNYWDNVWKNSKYFESMSLSLYYYQHTDLTKSEFNKIKTWVNRCTCWEHSDDLSKIFAHTLEQDPELVLPVLQKWNKSKNLWKRRQSVVSLLEYRSKRKKVLPFKILIGFIENLLQDEEYYVQKGVGWSLREIYNAYPKQTLSFIKNHLAMIDPIAYSAATEKIDKETKKILNEKRKALRKK